MLRKLVRLVIVALLSVSAFTPVMEAAGADKGTESTITIDAREPIGPLSSMYRANMFLNEYPLNQMFRTFFSDLKPGLIQVMPLKDALNVGSLAEYINRLPSLPATKWAMETHARGGRVMIGLTDIPKWLRQGDRQDAYLRPPRDLAGWAEFVEANVRFFNGTLKLDAMFVAWDEPDSPMFWKDATEQDYFALYRAFVVGARRADPAAKVGGPATSSWTAKRLRSDAKQPMLKSFIDYCAQTSAQEVGLQKLPLDFIVWHQFNTDPKGDPLLYIVPVARVPEWLKAGGYDPATPLIIGAWNSWMNFGRDRNELSPERDQTFAAAYAVHAVVAMEQAGIWGHNFFSFSENWQWNALTQDRREKEFGNREFFGGFGLFTRNGIVKPVFNAFRAMSMLEGSRLRATSNDSYLSVVATRAGDTVYVLVANFHWPSEGLMALKGRTLIANGYPLQELATLAKALSPSDVKDLEGGKRSIASMAIPDRAKNELEALSYLDELYSGRESPKTVQVTVEGLPGEGDVQADIYTIDDEHGNILRSPGAVSDSQSNAMSRIRSSVGQQLIQWGMVSREFSKWDRPKQEREIQAALSKLSGQQRRTVEDVIQSTASETLVQLNRSPEVGLNRQTFGPVERAEGRVSFDARVKPYSVNLFVLHGK